MNGIYDLGGMAGFGAVEIERDEPVFHEPWERLGHALGMAAGVGFDEAGARSNASTRGAAPLRRPTSAS